MYFREDADNTQKSRNFPKPLQNVDERRHRVSSLARPPALRFCKRARQDARIPGLISVNVGLPRDVEWHRKTVRTPYVKRRFPIGEWSSG